MLLLGIALVAANPVPAVDAPDGPRAVRPVATNPNCPRTTSYYAWQRGKPLTPKKLTELPPATAYMAVYRTINGCEVPMTAVEYRNSSGR